MIRRSEKRSLIGPEAFGSADVSPETTSQAAAQALYQTIRFFVRTGTIQSSREPKIYATVGEPFLNMPASKRKTWQLRITF